MMKLTNYGKTVNPDKELAVIFLGEINNYPKSKRIQLIKRTNWILPHIVQDTPITGAPTFYTDANKSGKTGYKSDNLSKVKQSPYNSVQKAEL